MTHRTHALIAAGGVLLALAIAATLLARHAPPPTATPAGPSAAPTVSRSPSVTLVPIPTATATVRVVTATPVPQPTLVLTTALPYATATMAATKIPSTNMPTPAVVIPATGAPQATEGMRWAWMAAMGGLLLVILGAIFGWFRPRGK